MARFRFARGNARKCRGVKPKTKRTGVASAENLEGRGGRVCSRAFPRNESSEGQDADDQPVDCQATPPAQGAQQSACVAGVAAEARRMHARLYDHAEKAELGLAQSVEGAPDQRVRGHKI